MSFEQPKIGMGEPVLYYERPFTAKPPILAVIHNTWNGFVEVKEWESRAFRSNVHHIDDPALKTNPNFLANGAWDRLQIYKDVDSLQSQVADMQRRLSTMEAKSDDKPVKKAEKPAKASKEPSGWEALSIETLREIATANEIKWGTLGWTKRRFAKEFALKNIQIPTTETVG